MAYVFSTRYYIISFTGDDYKIVTTPAFAESVSEGDVKWDKSMQSNFVNLLNYIKKTT